jgi:sugar lactone lactonase YvrE
MGDAMGKKPLDLTLALGLLAACSGSSNDSGSATATEGSTGASASTGGSTGAGPTPTTGEPTGTSTGEASTTGATSSGTGEGTTGSTGEGTGASTGESTGGDAVIVVEGLSHPESIVHDLVDDVYFISNINGAPDGVDDDGFISRVLPDGTIDALTFIDGAGDGVVLDAPKGMVILEDTLWVADITRVRKFDRVSGAPLGEVVIDGAVFLNDLAADAAGNIYVSDTGGNILYTIDGKEQASVLLASPAIFGPNGLFVAADRLYLATYDDTKIFSTALDLPVALPEITLDVGQLDGLVRLGDGDWLVSSWELPGVLRVAADFSAVSTQVPDLSSPADIAVDEGRKRILIPRLLEDRAEFHPY